MAGKLVWGVVIGVVVGAALGTLMGNTPIGIAICIAAGAIVAAALHYVQQRQGR